MWMEETCGAANFHDRTLPFDAHRIEDEFHEQLGPIQASTASTDSRSRPQLASSDPRRCGGTHRLGDCRRCRPRASTCAKASR